MLGAEEVACPLVNCDWRVLVRSAQIPNDQISSILAYPEVLRTHEDMKDRLLAEHLETHDLADFVKTITRFRQENYILREEAKGRTHP